MKKFAKLCFCIPIGALLFTIALPCVVLHHVSGKSLDFVDATLEWLRG